MKRHDIAWTAFCFGFGIFLGSWSEVPITETVLKTGVGFSSVVFSGLFLEFVLGRNRERR